VPSWKIEANGLIRPFLPTPVTTSEPVENVTLIPIGCAGFWVSVFSVVH
jgi:hypothetical protein